MRQIVIFFAVFLLCLSYAAASTPDCLGYPDGTICNSDGDECTLDICISYTCSHDPVYNSDCTGEWYSENPCIECKCDEFAEEYTVNKPDMTDCPKEADTDPCTYDGKCISGVCEHVGVAAGDACTDEAGDDPTDCQKFICQDSG